MELSQVTMDLHNLVKYILMMLDFLVIIIAFLKKLKNFGIFILILKKQIYRMGWMAS